MVRHEISHYTFFFYLKAHFAHRGTQPSLLKPPDIPWAGYTMTLIIITHQQTSKPGYFNKDGAPEVGTHLYVGTAAPCCHWHCRCPSKQGALGLKQHNTPLQIHSLAPD